MDAANEFLSTFWQRFNAPFAVEPKEPESAFAPLVFAVDEDEAATLCLKVLILKYVDHRFRSMPSTHSDGCCPPRCVLDGARPGHRRTGVEPVGKNAG